MAARHPDLMPTRAPRIVPTGPESFGDEILLVDSDFFTAPCCDDCRVEAVLLGRPTEESDAGEDRHDGDRC